MTKVEKAFLSLCAAVASMTVLASAATGLPYRGPVWFDVTASIAFAVYAAICVRSLWRK